jgi:hypothetical protein
MATGKHIGKVLVQIRPEEDSRVVVSVPWLMQAYPQYFCNPNYSYIIAGTGYSYNLLSEKYEIYEDLRVITTKTATFWNAMQWILSSKLEGPRQFMYDFLY